LKALQNYENQIVGKKLKNFFLKDYEVEKILTLYMENFWYMLCTTPSAPGGSVHANCWVQACFHYYFIFAETFWSFDSQLY